MDKQQNELIKSYFRARKVAVEQPNQRWGNLEYIYMIDNKMVDIDNINITPYVVRMFYNRPDLISLFVEKLNNLDDYSFIYIIEDNKPLFSHFYNNPLLKKKIDNFSDEVISNPSYQYGLIKQFLPRINNLPVDKLMQFIESKSHILKDLQHLSKKFSPDEAIMSLANSYPYEKVLFFKDQIIESLGSESLLKATYFKPRLKRHIWSILSEEARDLKKIKMTMLPLYDGSFAYVLDSNREKNVMDYKGNVITDKNTLQRIRNNIDVHSRGNTSISQRIDDKIKNG